MKKSPSTSLPHHPPKDLRDALTAAGSMPAWKSLTPLARNEWICWTISVAKAETRAHHIKRACAELKEGKRRPCCFPGCIHRR